MKIYIVEAYWYDDIHEEDHFRNLAAFTSKESAQKYVKELMDTFNEDICIYGVPDDEVDLWISEYELRD